MESPISFSVDDDLTRQMSGAIEVTVHMQDGSSRWCYFIRPEALAECGDWIGGTKTRIHFAAPNMIVVAGELNQNVIGHALEHVAKEGKLEQCSLPVARMISNPSFKRTPDGAV
jgi:hypothetical protein